MKKSALQYTGLALAGAAGALLAGAAWGYQTAFARSRRRQSPIRSIPRGADFDSFRAEMLENIDKTLAQPYEWLRIRSADGTELVGKFYRGRPGAPLVLFFHGYRSAAERDGSGGFQLCRERGWHVLMADQRAHGESGGRTITFGIREREDCLAWAEEMTRRMGPETPIFLWGISMGAATVLMASELELPETVRGIAADCGYDSPAGILKETLRRRHWPVWPLYRLVALGARVFGGFSLREASALEAVRHARVPILLIHGEADHTVPCEMAQALQEACASPVTLLTVPRAGHGVSWYVDPPGYREAMERFVAENAGETRCSTAL